MSLSEFAHPRVFISYTHDSPDHKRRVLNLSERLRGNGIDSNIDQYESSPPEGWPLWMIKNIEEADFILVVCTEIYQRRILGNEVSGKGLGGRWEGKLIIQRLHEAAENSRVPLYRRAISNYERSPSATKMLKKTLEQYIFVLQGTNRTSEAAEMKVVAEMLQEKPGAKMSLRRY